MASRRRVGLWPSSSLRAPIDAPTLVKVWATVLVTFAATGGRPAASSAGYVTRDARLTRTLTIPPATPAANRARVGVRSTRGV